jgi:endonuclease/exonuclease/phosphatase family metal-dependent hydrolase
VNQADSDTNATPTSPESQQAGRLRLLSYNIQVGIRTSAYREYLTGGWKHLLPHRARIETLSAIAEQISAYDLVAIQETDSGSLRTGFINQTEYLARLARFDWWTDRTNRRLGALAQHSIGALSRLAPDAVEALALPGPVRGRGALLLHFGEGDDALGVAIVHLALGRQTRRQQLRFLAERLKAFRHAVVMGDFNAPHGAPEMREFFDRTGLVEPAERFNTWPAWRPAQNYDHILVTPDLAVARFSVLADSHSDHLPVALDLTLPATLSGLTPPESSSSD